MSKKKDYLTSASEGLTGLKAPEAPMGTYRFIRIQQSDNEMFEGHPVFRIYNRKSGAQLGIISWYKPWKEYVFSSQPECVFNNSCLRDVLDFIETKI
jgi:hypothetical protein